MSNKYAQGPIVHYMANLFSHQVTIWWLSKSEALGSLTFISWNGIVVPALSIKVIVIFASGPFFRVMIDKVSNECGGNSDMNMA